MSERIRYIKDTQITIAVDGSRCADKVCELRLDTGEPQLQLFQCHNWFYDDLARDALIEALQALRDHGNFASLKPEVKYRGLVIDHPRNDAEAVEIIKNARAKT
jgi:hypothetical protein